MYKYFTFSEYALVNLLNNEFYMNHYEAFNDPFECWANVLSGFPDKSTKNERLLNIFKAWGFNSLDDAIANDNYDLLKESLVGSEPNIKEIIRCARITCFSKRDDNLLMWSHYADGLRGFCIEYDPSLILSNDKAFSSIHDVHYTQTPAVIDTAIMSIHSDLIDYNEYAMSQPNYSPGSINYKEEQLKSINEANHIFEKILATKPLEWAYEEEIRLISQTFNNENQDNLFNYPPQAVKSVIFGEKMPTRQQDALRYIFEASDYPVSFKKASRDNNSFKILIKEL
jgi:hypothetical protein